jgi:phosphoribosylformylglycinamidine synthase
VADLLTLIGGPDLASRKWIFEQYDFRVGGDTLQKSDDAAVVRIHGTDKALAISTDCTRATSLPTPTRAANRP